MRLLRTVSSPLEVIEFTEDTTPPYVILSHTWGPPSEEVTLQELSLAPESAEKKKPGYAKIKQCCAKAAEDGFDYAWVDTCW